MRKKIIFATPIKTTNFFNARFTAGKRYQVIKDYKNSFTVLDDNGEEKFPDWKWSGFCDCGDWIRTEEWTDKFIFEHHDGDLIVPKEIMIGLFSYVKSLDLEALPADNNQADAVDFIMQYGEENGFEDLI